MTGYIISFKFTFMEAICMLLVISSIYLYVGTGNGGSNIVNFTLADHGIATHILTFICSHYM